MAEQLQTNTIICGDSAEVLATFPNDCIDLTVTSPPYDNLRTYQGISWDDDRFYEIAKQLFRVTKDGGVLVWVVADGVVNGSETGSSFRQALYFMKMFKLHDTMIYKKNGNPQPTPANHKRYHQTFEYMFVFVKGDNGPKAWNPIRDRRNATGNTHAAYHNRLQDGTKFRSTKDDILIREWGMRWNVWEYVTGASGTSEDPIAYAHPAVFPEKLARDHIISWSNEGDLVLDPFAGSGTTLKMAHENRRKWLGIEISQKYIDIANRRLEKYINQGRLF